MDQQFVQSLMSIGILSYREQETLWNIASRCTKTAGIPLAGVGFITGAKVGTVILPGIGTISASAAGALAGLAGGTISCVMLNVSMRQELRKLAQEF